MWMSEEEDEWRGLGLGHAGLDQGNRWELGWAGTTRTRIGWDASKSTTRMEPLCIADQQNLHILSTFAEMGL